MLLIHYYTIWSRRKSWDWNGKYISGGFIGYKYKYSESHVLHIRYIEKLHNQPEPPRFSVRPLVQDKSAGKPQHYINNLLVPIYDNMVAKLYHPAICEQYPVCGEFYLNRE